MRLNKIYNKIIFLRMQLTGLAFRLLGNLLFPFIDLIALYFSHAFSEKLKSKIKDNFMLVFYIVEKKCRGFSTIKKKFAAPIQKHKTSSTLKHIKIPLNFNYLNKVYVFFPPLVFMLNVLKNKIMVKLNSCSTMVTAIFSALTSWPSVGYFVVSNLYSLYSYCFRVVMYYVMYYNEHESSWYEDNHPAKFKSYIFYRDVADFLRWLILLPFKIISYMLTFVGTLRNRETRAEYSKVVLEKGKIFFENFKLAFFKDVSDIKKKIKKIIHERDLPKF